MQKKSLKKIEAELRAGSKSQLTFKLFYHGIEKSQAAWLPNFGRGNAVHSATVDLQSLEDQSKLLGRSTVGVLRGAAEGQVQQLQLHQLHAARAQCFHHHAFHFVAFSFHPDDGGLLDQTTFHFRRRERGPWSKSPRAQLQRPSACDVRPTAQKPHVPPAALDVDKRFEIELQLDQVVARREGHVEQSAPAPTGLSSAKLPSKPALDAGGACWKVPGACASTRFARRRGRAFGRVAMGVTGESTRGDGATNFCPVKIWALGSTWSQNGERALVKNYLMELGWCCQAPFLPVWRWAWC